MPWPPGPGEVLDGHPYEVRGPGMSALEGTLGLTPGAVLRLFGMRRSGNHAIAGWLTRNAPSGGSVFLNNCVTGKSPLSSFRTIEVNGIQAPTRTARADLAATVAPAGQGALLLISYEDSSPAEDLGGRAMSGDFDVTAITHDIVIYRGFLNWAASLLKKLQGNARYSVVRRDAVLLRSIDTYTRVLGLVEDRDVSAVTPICYDDWCASTTYRAGLLDRLGLTQRDNTLGAVQPYGGGSSFQKDATDPADLEVAARWMQMADDFEYRAILTLAAMDAAFMARLDAVFPDDAAQLRGLTGGPT